VKLHQSLFLILVALFPVQLAYHFWPDNSLVLGLRVDYLSPALYLTDLLLALTLLLYLAQNRPSVSFLSLVAVLSLFLAVVSFQSQNQAVSFYKQIKITELLLLGFYVSRHISLKQLFYPLSAALFYSSLLALSQFFSQSSLGGLLWWLGERPLSVGQPGVAKVSLFGELFLRPYATFPHPNSLAGFMLVSLILVLAASRNFRHRLVVPLVLLAITTILFSFSRSVFVIGLILSLYWLWKNTPFPRYPFRLLLIPTAALSFLLLFANLRFLVGESLSQRLFLNDVALNLIASHPLLGVGLNNFLTQLPDFWQPGQVFLLQPVHNIYLLIAAETGLSGLLLFSSLIYYSARNLFRRPRQSASPYLAAALVVILFTGLIDHYWFTLQQNQFLFALVLGLIWAPPSASKNAKITS